MDHSNYVKLFAEFYDKNSWGDSESRSGPGSTLEKTKKLVLELPNLFSKFQIKSILDLPCGDFNWMATVPMDSIDYIGADIVDKIISDNKVKYPRINFVKLDILTDQLPIVDLIISRDCLVHFPNHEVHQALANICRSKSKYLLTTTFPSKTTTGNLEMGQWRPLNLQSKLFNLPEPLAVINENLDLKGYEDKSMALWSIDSIEAALIRELTQT